MQKQTATKNDVGIVGSWAGSGPMLWVDHIATRYQLTLGSNGLSGYLDSGHNPIAGQWQHLAATYDGTTARFYIDGIEVAITRRLGQRRQLQHLAHRRLRHHPRRLLRRPHRRRPHLRPRPQRRRSPIRHEPAGEHRERRSAYHSPVTLAVTARTQIVGVRRVDAVDRRRRRRRLQPLPRRRAGDDDRRHDVHVHRPRLLDQLPVRGRGFRRRRERLAARASWPRRRHCATRRRVWSRRIRSMRGRVRSPSTLLGTGTSARSRVRRGRPDATAAGSPSTAATPTSASERSAPSTRALSRSRRGCRSRPRPRTTSASSAAGPAAARCCGSTTSPPATSSPSEQRPLRLPRLRPQPDRRPVATPRRHLRRHHRPLLHRRHRGRLTRRLRQRRQLQHLAHRRLRHHARAASSTASSTTSASTTAPSAPAKSSST